MNPIRTIVCAFDFSDTANHALAQASALARRHGAKILLAHVVESVPVAGYPAIVVPPSDVALREIVEKQVAERVQQAKAEGHTVEGVVRLGDPGTQLIELAEEVEADLVVLGTRGLTGVKHVLLGSVAESVVRRCPLPVLTVHPDDPLLGERIETILVPTDLSPNAEIATEFFGQLFANGDRPRILLAYADRTPPYLDPFTHSVLELTGQPDPIKEDLLERMQPGARALEEAGFEVERRVVDGEAAEAIPKLAEKESVAMIVMSTHGRGALANTLLGRTAQRIVQHAPCPTLTIRSRRKKD